MKIKSFYTTAPLFEGGRFDEDKPICVFDAPAVFLHMMRCFLDGESDDTPIDESKERTFVSRVTFELNGEDVELCGVLCDDQSFFVGVKDGDHFSAEKTAATLSKLRKLKSDERNSYSFLNKYVENENNLSECDYSIANFNRFIELAKEETAKGDTRPIYVFNFFLNDWTRQLTSRRSLTRLLRLADRCLLGSRTAIRWNAFSVITCRSYNCVTILPRAVR